MRDAIPPKDRPSFFVASLDPAQIEKLENDLKEKGFDFSQPAHSRFSAKKEGVSCTVYASGKIVVQGKGMRDFIEFYLEPEILGSPVFTHAAVFADKTPRIGVDESGKGDFFGPLCIAGVYADEAGVDELVRMGVRDSKLLGDPAIERLARSVSQHFACHVVCIRPKRYNELYLQFGNLNTLLAWGHATVIEKLAQSTGCQEAHIDQFAAEWVVKRALAKKDVSVNLSQRHRGESDPVVAAASILARATFVRELKLLGEEFHIELPKGASPMTVKVGRQLVSKHGVEVLTQLGKVHFKTYQAILQSQLDFGRGA